jgi:hypothetical protein
MPRAAPNPATRGTCLAAGRRDRHSGGMHRFLSHAADARSLAVRRPGDPALGAFASVLPRPRLRRPRLGRPGLTPRFA